MFCRKCGTELADDARFCNQCGEKFVNKSTPNIHAEARWETESVQIAPQYETQVINDYESFGWEVHSTQTVDKQDSHLENRFGDIYSVTETEKYVKITFRRNKNMPNYQQLSALEAKYHAAEHGDPPNDTGKRMKGIGALSIFISLALLYHSAGIFIGLIGICIGVFLFIFGQKKSSQYKIEYAAYVQECEESDQVRYECLQEAESLLNEQ